MDTNIKQLLISLAAQYETPQFLVGDPSWFMHQTGNECDAELMGFVASCFSYGRRDQFMPRINLILQSSGGEMARWISSRVYREVFSDREKCFYRLSTNADLCCLLDALAGLIDGYGSLKQFVCKNAHDGFSAIKAFADYFDQTDVKRIVPRNTSSACKRLCMFLRWMVRSDSPVDLGLWRNLIDRRTLIMPLDTHVLQESVRLNLLQSKQATMKTAIQLTQTMSEAFPDDPLKGDFALFGLGVTGNE